jgi:hypothetical protein
MELIDKTSLIYQNIELIAIARNSFLASCVKGFEEISPYRNKK